MAVRGRAVQIFFHEICEMPMKTFRRVMHQGEIMDLAIEAIKEGVVASGDVPGAVPTCVVGEGSLVELRKRCQIGRSLACHLVLWHTFIDADGTLAELIDVFACFIRGLVEIRTTNLTLQVGFQATAEDAFLPFATNTVRHAFSQDDTTFRYHADTRIHG